MGRKPIHRKAMTAAERQRRRRTRIKRKLIALGAGEDKAERRKRRLLKIGKQVVPAPPGITYWREDHRHHTGRPVQTWAPITEPAASVALMKLTDGEIEDLIMMLEHEQDRRDGSRAPMGNLETAAFRIMCMGRGGDFLSKLEMYARNPRAARDIWGNEICIGLGVM